MNEKNINLVQNLANNYNLSITNIGKIIDERFIINDIDISLNELKDLYFNSFSKILNKI